MRTPLLLTALAALLASCAPNDSGELGTTRPRSPKEISSTNHYAWSDKGGSDPVKVHVNLGTQRLYVTRGDKRVGWCYVSTGREGHDTPAGTYRVTEKIADKRSNLYGWIENSVGERVERGLSMRRKIDCSTRVVTGEVSMDVFSCQRRARTRLSVIIAPSGTFR